MINLNAPALVLEFIQTFEASLCPRLWKKLVDEETAEVLEAVAKDDRENVLKELTDLAYVLTGLYLTMPSDELLTEPQWQDLYFSLEDAAGAMRLTLVQYDFDAEVTQEAFRRVHASNMSKLGEDGKPIRREDGKILKGPNYKAADLSDLI